MRCACSCSMSSTAVVMRAGSRVSPRSWRPPDFTNRSSTEDNTTTGRSAAAPGGRSAPSSAQASRDRPLTDKLGHAVAGPAAKAILPVRAHDQAPDAPDPIRLAELVIIGLVLASLPYMLPRTREPPRAEPRTAPRAALIDGEYCRQQPRVEAVS